jgi:hypothetical protein
VRSLFLVALMTALVAAAARSRAEGGDADLDLRWDAPSGCPAAEGVEAEVERLLGARARRGEPVDAAAVVTHSERGWSLVLTTHVAGVEGRRVLEARSCEALAEALAIVLAMTIDPSHSASPSSAGNGNESEDASDGAASALADAGARADAGVSADAAVSAVDASTGSLERASASTPGSSTFALGLALAGNVGALPSVAFAPELSIGWQPPRLSLDAALAYFPGARGAFDDARGGDFRLATAALRGCVRWGGANLEIGPCLAVTGGAMFGEGAGVRSPGSAVAPWLSLSPGAVGAVRLGGGAVSVWILSSVAAEVPLVRDRFRLDGLGVVHQPAAIAGRATLGGEIRF